MEKSGNSIDIVKTIMTDYKSPQIEGMPDFIGGAVGYVGYDIIRNYEKLQNINKDDIEVPELHLLLTKELVVYDHVKQKIKIIVNVPISDNVEQVKRLFLKAKVKLKDIKRDIEGNTCSMDRSIGSDGQQLAYESSETKESYMEKVIKAKEYIRNGDLFQVVLSQRLQVETNLDPFKAYRTLRSLNPSPYMFFINFGDYQVVGSSPELLAKVDGNHIETCPIAGTRPRGVSKEADEKYAKELLNDEKELAEHLMLIDLARNDIGKVSKFGTVEVNQYMEIQKYSHVMHIVSNVIGEKREDYDMYDVLISCLPAGTVSGAPKVRAMEIIDELESRKRGLYAGAVGYLGFNGNMDTCIAIRTMIFKDCVAYIQAGAGIVADSNPESEYEETLRKAKALMETIMIAEGVLV